MTDTLNVSVRELASGVVVLDLQGKLDWDNSSMAEEALEGLFTQGICRIAVNLAKIDYISSPGFACFVGALDQALARRGGLVFLHTPDRVRSVFTLLGLGSILTFADSEEEAERLLSR